MDKFGEVLKILLKTPGFDINGRERSRIREWGYSKDRNAINKNMDFLCFYRTGDVQKEQVNALRLLIQAGADPRAIASIDNQDEYTLPDAIRIGCREIVQLVLEGFTSSCSSEQFASLLLKPRKMRGR